MQISRQKGGKTFVRLASVFALLSAVAACGGGDAPQKLTIKGTAATGAAMSDATITAKCATGTQTGKAATSGSYSLVVEGGALPCLLEAKKDSTTLYSMASGNSTEAVANITPITHTVVAKALGDEAKLKEAFAAPKPDALRAAATELAEALAAVRVALTDVADYSPDPFVTPFKAAHTGSDGKPVAGDTFDLQLDVLQEKLSDAQSTLSQLVNAIATSQTEGDTAPAANVVGVLTPPASSTCPNVRSGQYITASQRGELSANGPGTFDAAKMTWTTLNGTQTVTLTVELDIQCKVKLKNGESAVISAVFNSQGMGIWRDDLSSGSSTFGLVFPYQRNTLADLAGTWNMVGFNRDDMSSKPAFGFGKATIKVDGTWEHNHCPTNNGAQACEGWKIQAATFTVSDGKFTNVDGHGYLYKAPNGTKLYVHSFGEEYGLVVAAQPNMQSMPTVGDESSYWTVDGSFSGSSALSAATQKVTQVDTENSTVTRSDGQIRVINKPADGMSYRAATADKGAVIYMHAKGLLTVYGREKKDAYSFVGFSIGL